MVRDWCADPDFSIYFVVFMVLAAALFLRQPSGVGGGFVFDEQEAILANPYVRGHQPWTDAFRRDFWGLLPDRSIGSYRPLPNFLWRALWRLNELRSKGAAAPINTPFIWFNIVFHATNAAILSSLVRGVTRRVTVGWLVGAIFCGSAILTEAVSGIVGVADVLGGLSLILAICALSFNPWIISPAVFAATLFGLLSKESALINVGLVPLAALFFAQAIAPEKPRALLRAVSAFIGATLALVVYFKIRHRFFHLEIPYDHVLGSKGAVGRLLAWFKHYVGGPDLPVDPFNNPLADPTATTAQRWSGALRVYFRGFVQVLLPRNLSPDYSMPQEPIPTRVISIEAILGALFLIGPPLLGALIWFRARRGAPVEVDEPRANDPYLGDAPSTQHARFTQTSLTPRTTLLTYAMIAWPAAFFPLSNIPKLLPTVRAERFWYNPVLAISVVVALLLAQIARKRWVAGFGIGAVFLLVQLVQARRHTNHFKNDLTFWQSASLAVPNSAKAHLNYSVMLGARAVELWKYTTKQAQEARLVENIRATELAPHWDMAFIYVGDTLCQLNRMDEAWDWYKKGFRIGPANRSLIALALQCMSDHNALLAKETDALALVSEKDLANSWADHILRDTLKREHNCRGISQTPAPDEHASDQDLEHSDMVDPEPGDSSANESANESANATASESTVIAGSAGSSASASTSTSASASATAAVVPLPTCGVDPQDRPRGLDGDPKSE
ncbi:MAG: hypothetical protein NVS3B20_06260 [Polyangiales bacterium]